MIKMNGLNKHIGKRHQSP